jgi:hypothetical protein
MDGYLLIFRGHRRERVPRRAIHSEPRDLSTLNREIKDAVSL